MVFRSTQNSVDSAALTLEQMHRVCEQRVFHKSCLRLVGRGEASIALGECPWAASVEVHGACLIHAHVGREQRQHLIGCGSHARREADRLALEIRNTLRERWLWFPDEEEEA